MLEIELGLLADGCIGVESRLDAVSQHVDIHGCGGQISLRISGRGVAAAL